MGKVGTNHLAKSTEALSTKMLPEKWHHETCYGTLEEFTCFFPSSNSKEDNAIGRIWSGVSRSTFDLKPWTLRTFSISSKN